VIQLVVERITAWGQRNTPHPWTFIGYSNGNWTDFDGSGYERRGIYLGERLVAVFTDSVPDRLPLGYVSRWVGGTHLAMPTYDPEVVQAEHERFVGKSNRPGGGP